MEGEPGKPGLCQDSSPQLVVSSSYLGFFNKLSQTEGYRATMPRSTTNLLSMDLVVRNSEDIAQEALICSMTPGAMVRNLQGWGLEPCEDSLFTCLVGDVVI